MKTLSLQRSIKLVLPLLVSSLLVACGGSEHADLHAYVEEVNSRPKDGIEPLPEFKPFESFNYSAAGLRSPFAKPVEVRLIQYQQGKSKKDIKPDLNRPKEYLEGFSMDALKMVGAIRMGGDASLWALIDDSDGGVHRVKPGNFMGRNHGRVIDVNEDQIDVIEIVPDGHGGWLERPRMLKLQDES